MAAPARDVAVKVYAVCPVNCGRKFIETQTGAKIWVHTTLPVDEDALVCVCDTCRKELKDTIRALCTRECGAALTHDGWNRVTPFTRLRLGQLIEYAFSSMMGFDKKLCGECRKASRRKMATAQAALKQQPTGP